MKQVLLVEGSPLFRLGLKVLIQEIDPELDVIEADSIAGAKNLLSKNSGVSLILLDMAVQGFVGLSQLRSEFPLLPVIILSNDADNETVSRAITFGASGYISKSAPCDTIMQTLRAALSGKTFTTMPIGTNSPHGDPFATLSQVQRHILTGLKRGLRNKEIATELGLTEKTIKGYMGPLYRKLGVSTRAQALELLEGFSE